MIICFTSLHSDINIYVIVVKLYGEYYILDLIIEDYHDKQTNPFETLTPVDLLKALMDEKGYSGY